MKRSYSVPALCAAANKHFFYDIQDGCLYLADKRGTFGLRTEDLTLLDDLQNRPTVTVEPRPCAKTLQGILDTKGTEVARDTGIFVPRSGNLCRVIRLHGQNDDQIALVDDRKLAPFKPDLVVGTTRRSPLILVCSDCLAIVCPVNYDNTKLESQLLALDETLNA